MNENENLVPKRRFKEFTNTGTWEQRKLGDMVEFFSGLTYSPDNVIKQPGTLVLRSSNVQNGEIVNADNVYVDNEVVNSDNVQVGDIAVVVRNGSRSLIGKHAAIKYPMKDTVIGAFMTGVRSDTPSFTNALLDTQQFETEIAKNLGATINQITTGNFKKMIFNFPEIDERLRIGDFFNQLDNTIALHQRKLEKSKALKSAYLSEMFPAEGERKPKRRFAGFTDDWEQRKLIDVAEMFDNLRIPVTASDRVEGNTAYYGANGIQDYVDGFTHDGEFVLIAEDGANDLINYPVNYVKGKIWVNNHAHVVSGKKSELDNLFLTARIKSMNISHWLVGGGRAKLNGDVLKKIPLTLPIYEEQKKIGAFFKQLDDAIALHQRKLEKTKALKSAYLSELFPVEGERKPKRRFAGFIDDWKQGTVGEYGYFYYGKSAPKWSVTKDAIIPCVRYGELYTKFGAKIDKVYSYTNISKENLKFSTGNEVLVPRVGEDPLDFANCSWLSIPNVAIGEMISVYNTEENPLFISYYFNSQLRHAFAKRVEGGNVSNLYFTYLENITISIPNKEEQDTIANFLESLDSVVEHHQHKLEKLKNIKQAYLNELFV